MRFTESAMAQLEQWAADQPNLWLAQDTDFIAELARAGVKESEESTPVKAQGPIEMPKLDSNHRQDTDRHSLKFSENLTGLTATAMADPNTLAWISCVHLLQYCRTRWPLQAHADPANWVRRRFLSNKISDITMWNAAGRILWLAETSRRVAEAQPHLSPERVLEHFVANPEHYHQCHEYILMRSDRTAGEYVWALMDDAQGINREGARELAREINRAAGARLLDILDTKELRVIVSEAVDTIMRRSEYVQETHRDRYRGRRDTQVLSLGAGVQSTVLALMAEHGYRGMQKPDFALFADTGWEPPDVYENLEWLRTQISYEIKTVSNGNIRDHILSGVNPEGRQFIDIPVYLKDENGRKSVATRQCTRVFKMEPIYRELRKRLGIEKGQKASVDVQVSMWLGITTDEASRKSNSKRPWITNVYPLLDLDISRAQMMDWFQHHYPRRRLPKSACVGCPYHTDAMWAELKQRNPESFQDAVFVDLALRALPQCSGRLKGKGYLHKSLQPLGEVNLEGVATETDRMEADARAL